MINIHKTRDDLPAQRLPVSEPRAQLEGREVKVLKQFGKVLAITLLATAVIAGVVFTGGFLGLFAVPTLVLSASVPFTILSTFTAAVITGGLLAAERFGNKGSELFSTSTPLQMPKAEQLSSVEQRSPTAQELPPEEQSASVEQYSPATQELPPEEQSVSVEQYSPATQELPPEEQQPSAVQKLAIQQQEPELLLGEAESFLFAIPLSDEERKEAVKARLKEVSNMESLEEVRQALGIEKSIDKGGHGGTFRAKIVLEDGSVPRLFLKPKDPVEFRNYQIIQFLYPDLVPWMPKFYGEVLIDGHSYLVLENARLDEEGKDLYQLADIKLAGKTDSGNLTFNPIANQNEMRITRGKTKFGLDFWQMWLGSKLAPHIMVYHPDKMKRLINFAKSENVLLKSLAENLLEFENPVKALDLLLEDLTELTEILTKAPFAFIGASLVFIQEKDRIRVLMIDPAHMQIDSKKKNDLETINMPTKRIYFSSNGKEGEYDEYKKSNNTGINKVRDLATFLKDQLDIGDTSTPDENLEGLKLKEKKRLDDMERLPDIGDMSTPDENLGKLRLRHSI